MSNALERHTLVWLTTAGWDAAIAAARPEHAAALAQWRQHDRPAVVRRQDAATPGAPGPGPAIYADCADTAGTPGAASDEVHLGLPLPPSGDGVKVRVALRASAAHIARRSAALALRSALTAAGPWRDELAVLCDAAPELRVFGSLAMQTLTGLQYVSPTSDVDLLFHPVSRRQLADTIALLARHAERLPLDGEVVFPGGAAVSWKEWHTAITHPAKVMVKELHAVRLADTASLLATLEQA